VADFDWLANSNNTSSSIALVGPSGVPTGHVASVTLNDRWLTTVTGRLGYAWDRVLVYGKGGGAWVGASDPTVTIDGLPTTFSSSNSNSGWLRCRVGVLGQLVRPDRVRFCWTEQPNLYSWPSRRSSRWRPIHQQQPKHSAGERWPQLQVRVGPLVVS
jgi:hypothetical protein